MSEIVKISKNILPYAKQYFKTFNYVTDCKSDKLAIKKYNSAPQFYKIINEILIIGGCSYTIHNSYKILKGGENPISIFGLAILPRAYYLAPILIPSISIISHIEKDIFDERKNRK